MNKIKKFLVVFLAAVACFSLAMGLAACGGDSDKVTIKLAGETANASGEYSAELNVGGSKSYTLIVGSLKDYELKAESSDSTVATATATSTTLSVNALKEGSAKITLSEKSGKANDLVLKVAVNPAPVVAPTGMILGGVNEGTGSITDPYVITLAEGQNTTRNMAVQPSGANNAFTWTVGTVEEETFTASEGAVTATQDGSALKITAGNLTGDNAETYYIKGEAQEGDLTVYVKVTVNKYVVLESITNVSYYAENVTGLTKLTNDADGCDYILNTAKGTNWNLDKAAGRINSWQNGGGNPANGKAAYYHSVNVFLCTPNPANATDTDWIITEVGDAGIFNALDDGNWEVTKAGTTIIEITNSKNEASVKVKLVVEDTLYTGILKSTYESATAETNLDWAYDDHADDTTATSARNLLNKWYFSVNKTTSRPDSDDMNQKIFWLGDTNRPYGFDMEMVCDPATGAAVTDTIALAWIKATVPAGATTLQAIFGSHSSDSNVLARISLVKEDGTVYNISGDWDNLGGKNIEYTIPTECQGATVALVLEGRLSQAEAWKSGELQCKGIWINAPITQIGIDATATVNQGSTYQIKYTTVPTKVVDDSVNYTVTENGTAVGEEVISIDEDGVVTIAKTAPVGDYVITLTSKANNAVTASITLKVEGYVAVTGFTAKYVDKTGAKQDLNGKTISAKAGAAAVDLEFAVNEDASVQTYTVAYSTENIAQINKDGKLTFTYEGTVTVTVTPDAEEAASMAVTFTVVVKPGQVLNWGEAGQNSNAAILQGSNSWSMNGGNSGVGEGADIQNNGSYLEKTIDVTDMDTLVVYARIFNGQQGGQTVYMEVKVGGQVITPEGYTGNAYLEEKSENDNAQAFYYDLSGITGEVTIRMTNMTGYHFVIQQITIS